MTKAPADQFYYGDWLRDTELQTGCASTRGIWMNLLSHLWFAKNRGKISGKKEQLLRLGNCTEIEFNKFLEENNQFSFADITIDNDIITVISRRQKREERERQGNRDRQKKHRITKMSQKDNKEIKNNNIPSSSSSSSSSTKALSTYEKTPVENFREKNDKIELDTDILKAVWNRCKERLQEIAYLPKEPSVYDLRKLKAFFSSMQEEAQNKDSPSAWFKDVCFDRMNENLEDLKVIDETNRESSFDE